MRDSQAIVGAGGLAATSLAVMLYYMTCTFIYLFVDLLRSACDRDREGATARPILMKALLAELQRLQRRYITTTTELNFRVAIHHSSHYALPSCLHRNLCRQLLLCCSCNGIFLCRPPFATTRPLHHVITSTNLLLSVRDPVRG